MEVNLKAILLFRYCLPVFLRSLGFFLMFRPIIRPPVRGFSVFLSYLMVVKLLWPIEPHIAVWTIYCTRRFWGFSLLLLGSRKKGGI